MHSIVPNTNRLPSCRQFLMLTTDGSFVHLKLVRLNVKFGFLTTEIGDYGFLGCGAVRLDMWVPTLSRNLPPRSLHLKDGDNKFLRSIGTFL